MQFVSYGVGNMKKIFQAAFPLTLPVMAGYFVLGIGFGVLLQRAGFGLFWALLMSFTIYSGSMQYVGVSLLSGGSGLVHAVIMTLTVNARYLFYGISMLDRYKGLGWKKWLLAFGLTDETYSIICTTPVAPDIDRGRFYLTISLLNQSYWIFGSCVGSLIGTMLAFNSSGMEFSMTALFVVLFVEEWIQCRAGRKLLALGMGVSLLCLVVLGVDKFIVVSIVLIITALCLFRRRLQDGI